MFCLQCPFASVAHFASRNNLIESGTSHFNLCFKEEETEAQTEKEFAWEHSASE